MMARRGGKGRRGRNVDGVLLLDKPAGITSNAALQRAKRLFNARRAGHTGSLDPLATGVLPLCFGEATKFSRFLLDADKHYLARVKLGVATDSGDADGQVVHEAEAPALSDKEVETVLDRFRGDILQVPSMFSALKVDGQPLYKLARQGIEVERKERPVSIYRLCLVERTADELLLDMECSKGTYVRMIAEDIGRDLGCGAHVTELRRLAVGPFDAARAVTAGELESLAGDLPALDAKLLPVSAAVEGWPSVVLPEITAAYIGQGQPVQVAGAPTEGWTGIFSESADGGKTFLGVGEILEDGRVAPRRLVVRQADDDPAVNGCERSCGSHKHG